MYLFLNPIGMPKAKTKSRQRRRPARYTPSAPSRITHNASGSWIANDDPHPTTSTPLSTPVRLEQPTQPTTGRPATPTATNPTIQNHVDPVQQQLAMLQESVAALTARPDQVASATDPVGANNDPTTCPSTQPAGINPLLIENNNIIANSHDLVGQATNSSAQLQKQITLLEQSISTLAAQHGNASKDKIKNPLLLTNVVEPIHTLAKTSAPQVTETIPLYSLISNDIKSKIKKGEFVDFYSLLNPTDGKVYGIKGKETDLGFITSLSEVQPKSKPLSIMSWCKAFARFASVNTKLNTDALDETFNKPVVDTALLHEQMTSFIARTQDTFNYLDTILDLASDNADWLYYDKHFRQQLSSNMYNLGAVRSDLYAKAVAGKTKTQHQTGFSPFRAYTTPKSPAKTVTSGTIYVPRGSCIAYHNRGTRCAAKGPSDCQYSHICFKCKDSKPHPAFQCSQATGTKQKAHPAKQNIANK